jgi:hypothetical protein
MGAAGRATRAKQPCSIAAGAAAMSYSLRALFLVASVASCDAAEAAESLEAKSSRSKGSRDRGAMIEPPHLPEVPGGDIFGFLSPTDIGDPNSFGYAAEFTGRAAKRDGRYATVTKKSQFSYTHSERLSFAVSPFVTYFDWQDVSVGRDSLLVAGEGVDQSHHHSTGFDGLSAEASWRLLARAAGQPLAITLSTETRWFRRDALTGFRVDGKQIEFKLFADIALTERWFAAVNAIYGTGTQRYDIPGAELQKGSAFGFLSAVTWQPYKDKDAPIEGVFVGLEARYISGFSGLTLNFMVGEALFVGPTMAIAFGNGSMLSLAWSPQLWGRGTVPSAPGPLELDAMEKHQFRFKFAMPLQF